MKITLRDDFPLLLMANWRGHWDMVSPGYGGYIQNVLEGGWHAFKSTRMEPGAKLDDIGCIIQLHAHYTSRRNLEKLKHIGFSVPEKPMDVHILVVSRQSSVFIAYIPPNKPNDKVRRRYMNPIGL